MQGFVIFGRSMVTGFLAEPFCERLFGVGNREGVGVHDNSGIVFCSDLVDEEVIVSAGDMVKRGETFVPEEQVLFIGKISADAHIGLPCQCVG